MLHAEFQNVGAFLSLMTSLSRECKIIGDELVSTELQQCIEPRKVCQNCLVF